MQRQKREAVRQADSNPKPLKGQDLPASHRHAAEHAQDLVGVAGDVMAALESLRPAFEAPADLEGALQDGAEHRGRQRSW